MSFDSIQIKFMFFSEIIDFLLFTLQHNNTILLSIREIYKIKNYNLLHWSNYKNMEIIILETLRRASFSWNACIFSHLITKILKNTLLQFIWLKKYRRGKTTSPIRRRDFFLLKNKLRGCWVWKKIWEGLKIEGKN